MHHFSSRRVAVLALLFIDLIALATSQTDFFHVPSPWVWVCRDKACVRERASSAVGTSAVVCRLTCYDSAVLWPAPTGQNNSLSRHTSSILAENIQFTRLDVASLKGREMLDEVVGLFKGHVVQMEQNGLDSSVRSCSAKSCDSVPYEALNHQVRIEVAVDSESVELNSKTDESYTLHMMTNTTTSITMVYISAPTFYGARHGIETLGQLIGWDDLGNSLVLLRDAHIEDAPAFGHRGLSLDTSRSYLEIPIIKRVIDGMSYNKLNVLHWHISDSHSFPFVSKREPMMAIYGAYSPRQVYRPYEIQELIQYAQVRGVRIIPELDGPAHVGAGWDWGPDYGLGDMVLCYDKQPWEVYCYEPPCGIHNPANPKIYKVLGNIYKDILDLFPDDLFHFGGDEVNPLCWNETKEITDYMANKTWGRDEEGFHKLWSEYQNKSLDLLDAASGKQKDVVLWTSTLTESAPLYLNQSRYIIQFWTDWNDTTLKRLIEQGYRLIMSNVDALYLDCGYGAWVGSGSNNWCSPYKGWQQVYENSPRRIIENFNLPYENHKHQFLGGEAALWTEQAQGWSIEGKLWPRLAALAERLWSDPIPVDGKPTWRAAESRLLTQRQRMVDRGIAADLMQPQWCMQNDGSCFL